MTIYVGSTPFKNHFLEISFVENRAAFLKWLFVGFWALLDERGHEKSGTNVQYNGLKVDRRVMMWGIIDHNIITLVLSS